MKDFFDKPDFGKLFLRVVLGAIVLTHAIVGLMGGVPALKAYGAAFQPFHITGNPVFWGLLLLLVRAVGSLCFMLGLFFRSACFMVTLSFAVALVYHINAGHDFLSVTSGATRLFAVYFAFLFIGPGSYTLGGRA